MDIQDIVLLAKLLNKLKGSGYPCKEVIALVHSIYVCVINN